MADMASAAGVFRRSPAAWQPSAIRRADLFACASPSGDFGGLGVGYGDPNFGFCQAVAEAGVHYLLRRGSF